jgi:hypothetical protein
VHILLTDILSCPRCGPEFGLILLADRIEQRRVLEGTLGCASCRGKFAVHDGVVDLRVGPAEPGAGEPNADAIDASGRAGDSELALRWAALMGVAEGPGFLLVAGPAARLAAHITALVDGVEVVAAAREPEAAPEQPGVSRIVVDRKLPFYSGKIRGVALSGSAADSLLEEGVRVLGPNGRLVLEPAPADAEQRLAASHARVVAAQGETMVASRV